MQRDPGSNMNISSFPELFVFFYFFSLSLTYPFFSTPCDSSLSPPLSISFVLVSVFSSYSISGREWVNVQSTFISCILCIVEIQFLMPVFKRTFQFCYCYYCWIVFVSLNVYIVYVYVACICMSLTSCGQMFVFLKPDNKFNLESWTFVPSLAKNLLMILLIPFSGFMPSQYRTTQFLKDPSLYDVRYTGSTAIGQYSKLPDSNISEEELLEMQQRAEEEAKTTQSWWTIHSYLKGLCDMVQWCDSWNICGLRIQKGQYFVVKLATMRYHLEHQETLLQRCCYWPVILYSATFPQISYRIENVQEQFSVKVLIWININLDKYSFGWILP